MYVCMYVSIYMHMCVMLVTMSVVTVVITICLSFCCNSHCCYYNRSSFELMSRPDPCPPPPPSSGCQALAVQDLPTPPSHPLQEGLQGFLSPGQHRQPACGRTGFSTYARPWAQTRHSPLVLRRQLCWTTQHPCWQCISVAHNYVHITSQSKNSFFEV